MSDRMQDLMTSLQMLAIHEIKANRYPFKKIVVTFTANGAVDKVDVKWHSKPIDIKD